MTTPKQLAELIVRTASASEVEETAGDLVFYATIRESVTLHDWRQLRARPPAYLDGVFIVVRDTDEELSNVADPDITEVFRFTLRKVPKPRELRIFFGQSLDKCAAHLNGCSHVQIADMQAEHTFATFSARFQRWTDDDAMPFAPSEPLADPRSLTKDFTGINLVPSDVRPWLLRAKPDSVGPSFDAWQRSALRQKIAALSDQVTLDGDTPKYHFNGPPTRRISLTDSELAGLAAAISAGAEWVFGVGRDTETRHMLFANEWSRGYQHVADADFGQRTLESAQSAYRAYVNSSSRETLKAPAELRKAVIDETQKVSQRAQDLASALWKDLAIASAPFVLKVFTDAANVAAATVAASLAFVAAIFLAFSFFMQVYINQRFFLRQSDSRLIWRQALNTVLSPDSLKEFSENPIENSVADYKKVRLAVGIFYGVLVVGLIGFAFFELQSHTPHPRPALPIVKSGMVSSSQAIVPHRPEQKQMDRGGHEQPDRKAIRPPEPKGKKIEQEAHDSN